MRVSSVTADLRDRVTRRGGMGGLFRRTVEPVKTLAAGRGPSRKAGTVPCRGSGRGAAAVGKP
eukprot:758854-Hanusia_phi.AAC.1